MLQRVSAEAGRTHNDQDGDVFCTDPLFLRREGTEQDVNQYGKLSDGAVICPDKRFSLLLVRRDEGVGVTCNAMATSRRYEVGVIK